MCGYDDSLTMSFTTIGTALELDPLERVGGVCRNWNKGRTEKTNENGEMGRLNEFSASEQVDGQLMDEIE